MNALVTNAGLAIALLSCCVVLGLVGGWYIRARVTIASARLGERLDAKLMAVADEMGRRMDAGLSRAAQDLAVATARVNEAIGHVERAEMGQAGLQRAIESLSSQVQSLHTDVLQARVRISTQHPGTADELRQIREHVEGVARRVEALSIHDRELAAALRATRPWQA